MVIFLNGHRITDRTADGKTDLATEQTMDANGLFGYQLASAKGVATYIEARLTKYWNAGGPNELLVVVRPGDYITGPVIFSVGQPPESSAAFDDASWRKVNLPHDFVVEGTFNEKYSNLWGSLPTPRAWYRKRLEIPESMRGKRISVEFDGIFRDSEIWFNGHYLGNHPSGYTSFARDLTPYVEFGQENTLSVRVDPRVHEGWWYSGRRDLSARLADGDRPAACRALGDVYHLRGRERDERFAQRGSDDSHARRQRFARGSDF